MPFPLIPLLGAAAGGLQALIGGGKARRAQKELENLQTPKYQKSQSILDYYNTALSRYGVDPTNSALYKRSMNSIGRNQATALSGLQDRRSALGGAASILRASNDATLNADVQAENQRNQRFGELGGATQLKAGEEMKDFQYNQLAPYEKKYNLLSMKAGAANQTANAGLSNIFTGLNSISQMNMLKQLYGNDASGGKKGGFYNTKFGKLYNK